MEFTESKLAGLRDLEFPGLKLTKHAQARTQQRAINHIMLDLIYVFGVHEFQRGNATFSYVPRKSIKALRSAIDRLDSVALIESAEGQVITAFHCTKRLHNKTRNSQSSDT